MLFRSLSDEEKRELEALQLEIINQYGRPSEGDDEGQEDDQTQPPGIDASGTGMSFPIDPETGYRVDPETGTRYDPDAGFAIDGGESVPDDTLPLNPNL